MMVSDAALAPTSPPETGASRYSQPSSLIFLANSLVAIGEIELMSTTILPCDRPSATPSSPNSTASTCGVSGTMMMMMSALLATSLRRGADRGAAVDQRIGRHAVVVVQVQLVAALACRCPAIGAPMMPSPMKPIFAMFVSS